MLFPDAEISENADQQEAQRKSGGAPAPAFNRISQHGCDHRQANENIELHLLFPVIVHFGRLSNHYPFRSYNMGDAVLHSFPGSGQAHFHGAL